MPPRPSAASEMEDEETHLVIGIDFGTTFSGVSWALSTAPKDIAIISQWESDSARAFDSDKVPTKLCYDQQHKILSWGFNIVNEDVPLSWFKLLLTPSAKKTVKDHRSYPKLMSAMANLEKQPVDITSDFLSVLWNHALKVLGTKIGESLLEIIKIKVVLTVPAIWDHQGQEMTRRAAANAGITTRHDTSLLLVSEPEAAALATFTDRGALKRGDSFVICDCGGGTADLVGYKIEGSEPLRLAMCSEATGGLYGATFLDEAFEETVISIIGRQAYVKLSPRSKKKLMEEWEHGIKKNFKHGEAQEKLWIVDIPGYPGPSSALDGAQAGFCVLKTAQVEAIFQKICPQICSLIADQVMAIQNLTAIAPKAVLLVGGLGENRFLLEEVRSKFPNLQVLQPNKAWSVISRGAVQWGLDENIVSNHIARFNYGLKVAEPYVEWEHVVEDRYWDKLEEIWRAQNQMSWYTRRGSNIGKTDPICRPMAHGITSRSELRNFTIDVYYSDTTNAPKRYSADVKHLCTVNASFPPYLWNQLEVHTNSLGQKYRLLQYEMEMQATGASLRWSIKHKNVEQGRTEVLAEYHLA